jgi:hypothetical protein
MDPLRRDQVQAWIKSTRRAVYTIRRSQVGPLKAIEVSERLYGMLQEYLIETADNLGEDVYHAIGTITFMHTPVIPDPNLPFEFEPLVDEPVVVSRETPVHATANPAAKSGGEDLSVSFLAGKGRL